MSLFKNGKMLNIKMKNSQLGYYLAGLIEGDGCI